MSEHTSGIPINDKNKPRSSYEYHGIYNNAKPCYNDLLYYGTHQNVMIIPPTPVTVNRPIFNLMRPYKNPLEHTIPPSPNHHCGCVVYDMASDGCNN
jgi:hypothetical protein